MRAAFPVPPLLLMLCLVTAAHAQDARDPIDVTWDDCASGGERPTAEQMLACHAAAAKAWGSAMETEYRDLLGHLKPPARDLLVAAQAEWTRYRDAELALWRALGDGPSDLNATISLRNAEAEIDRARALYLREYGPYFWMD